MYKHYIGVDWAQANMAIARITEKSSKVVVKDVPSDLKELQFYLKQLKGTKILTFEETNTAQWLYTELNPYVDKIVVCDPYRNHLLKEGPKTDKIDAAKLVKLLRADLLKPVFHSADSYIYMRKLVSAYEDVIKAGVRLKNQRSALFRSIGKNKKTNRDENKEDSFILHGVDNNIELYEAERERYQNEFIKLSKKHKDIKLLTSIPGIGVTQSIKIVSRVVDAKRFKNKNHFLSYCGLVKLERISGGKSYGEKKS
jgi:transposase